MYIMIMMSLLCFFIEYFNQFKYAHIDNVHHRSSTIYMEYVNNEHYVNVHDYIKIKSYK